LTPPEAEAPFDAPWQATAFALAVKLSEAGAFTWSEWAAALGAELATGRPYYEAWVCALESLAAGKGLASPAALEARRLAWEQAYLRTPHGRPVEL
jgi:nitrile hydratase accessory protein